MFYNQARQEDVAVDVKRKKLGYQFLIYEFFIYELFSGKRSFGEHKRPLQIARAIESGKRPCLDLSISAFMRCLIERCWSSNVEKRPIFCEIVEVLRCHQFDLFPGTDSQEVLSHIKRLDLDK